MRVLLESFIKSWKEKVWFTIAKSGLTKSSILFYEGIKSAEVSAKLGVKVLNKSTDSIRIAKNERNFDKLTICVLLEVVFGKAIKIIIIINKVD